jgi:hypothetical protein
LRLKLEYSVEFRELRLPETQRRKVVAEQTLRVDEASPPQTEL